MGYFWLDLSAGFVLGYCAYYIWNKMSDQSNLTDNFKFYPGSDEIRLMMCVRSDLKMKPGKIAAQCAHAALGAYILCKKKNPKLVDEWLSHGGTKIALRIQNEEEMFSLREMAAKAKLTTYIVRDAGQTQVSPGTRTVMAVGPATKTDLEPVTGHLKLL